MRPLDFDYELPKELIAQAPSDKRDQSRLMVIDRASGSLKDLIFSDLIDLIPVGDALVLNDTKVFPAKLLGKKKKTDGKVDILLLHPYEKPISRQDDTMSMGEVEELKSRKIWRCLVQPALKDDQEIVFPDTMSEAVFWKRDTDGIPLIEFKNTPDVMELARKIGQMPLPPYIKRESEKEDTHRYQTVYAKNEGAVAAPTAGFHFSQELLDRIKKKGIRVIYVTLHVGYGTFKPVDDPDHHQMHSEHFEVSDESAAALNTIREKGGKIWAVGTTSTRVLETCVQNKKIIPGKGETDIFIREPFEFEAVDHLITNFHLPKTTLLFLVGAFMGEDLRKKAYERAIKERYKFYSYGDAMVIL